MRFLLRKFIRDREDLSFENFRHQYDIFTNIVLS